MTGIVVLFCALAFQRGINLLGVRSRAWERALHGEESILIKEGVLQIDALRKSRISHQQIFAALRNVGIYNLGEVNRLYLEASGLMSIFKFKEPGFGLPIILEQDKNTAISGLEPARNIFVCTVCGKTVEADRLPEDKCGHCENDYWIVAMR